MTFYLKGNEVFSLLLELCGLYQLITPIIILERFRDFDIWVVTINDYEKAEKIMNYINISNYHYNVLKIEVNKVAQA